LVGGRPTLTQLSFSKYSQRSPSPGGDDFEHEKPKFFDLRRQGGGEKKNWKKKKNGQIGEREVFVGKPSFCKMGTLGEKERLLTGAASLRLTGLGVDGKGKQDHLRIS